MGVGEHFLIFHHHQQHHDNYHQDRENSMKKDGHHHHNKNHIPKGYVSIMVGHEDEEQKRFRIPLMYINHPLFMELLKESEEEYGFKHDGPINIPCHVQDFFDVQGMIDQANHHDHDHNHHHHSHHHHHICCFKDCSLCMS